MRATIIWAAAIAGIAASACGGRRVPADAPPAATGAPTAATEAPTAPDAQAGTGAAPATLLSPTPTASAAASAAPAERPFAKTPLEAQSMIQEQIDTRVKVLWKCVEAYRAKKGDPHKPVVADIGIDQEGNLIGITAPNARKGGDLDPALRTCLTDGLRGLAFPRSHAGVITVRQSFKDAAVYQ
jgi:hypothetical protein